MINNSNAVIVGRIVEPLNIKDVDVNGQTKAVGKFKVAVEDKKGNTTYYEIVSWSTAQHENLSTLAKNETVLVQGQLEAQSYDGTDGKDINLKVTNVEVTALGKAKISKQNIVATGRVTHDPELTKAGEHNLTRIGIAINHSNEKTTFLDIEMWDKQAELMTSSLHKGSLINVSGDIQLNRFEKQDGTKGSSLRIVNASVGFLDKRADASNDKKPTPTKQSVTSYSRSK